MSEMTVYGILFIVLLSAIFYEIGKLVTIANSLLSMTEEITVHLDRVELKLEDIEGPLTRR